MSIAAAAALSLGGKAVTRVTLGGVVVWPPSGGATPPSPPAEPVTSAVMNDLTVTSNGIRRITTTWSAPTVGNVSLTRQSANMTDGSTVQPAAPGSFFFSTAFPPEDQQVTVMGQVVNDDGTLGDPVQKTVALPPVPAPNPIPARRADMTRDPRYHPFTPDSPWNIPLPVNMQWEPVDSPATVSMRKETSATNGGFWASQGSDSHPVNHAKESDPLVTITDTKYSPRSGSAKIPLGAVVSSEYESGYHDGHSHVIDPSGSYVDECYQVQRRTESLWNVRRHHTVSLTGNALGPDNGTRAYGGSALGGLIRAHEVEAGVIPHVIAWLFRKDQILALTNPAGNYGYYTDDYTFKTRDRSAGDWCPDGWPLGTKRRGFSKGRGYRWPATEQDYVIDILTGNLPYGSLIGIPGDVDITKIGLETDAGRIVATAMQDYGAIFSDQGGSSGVQVEPAAPGWFREQLKGNFTAIEVRRIIRVCRVAAVNQPDLPGGVALDAPRRRPLAAAFGPASPSGGGGGTGSGSDTTAPSTAVTSPAPGSSTSRTVTPEGTYTDG